MIFQSQTRPRAAEPTLRRLLRISGCRSQILQRRAKGAAPGTVPPIVQQVLRSPGEPLHHAARAFVEPHFAHDFGHVRVHTSARAAASARAVNARAYTVGANVVFDTGEYAPGDGAGKTVAGARARPCPAAERFRLGGFAFVPGEGRRWLRAGSESDRRCGGGKNPSSRWPSRAALLAERACNALRLTPRRNPRRKPRLTLAPDRQRYNFCFIMGEGGAYYKLGDYFARTYYAGSHEIIHAASLCDMLDKIRGYADTLSAGDERKGIGEVVIISHADKEGRFYFPLNDGDTAKWMTSEDVAGILAPGWLEKIKIGCRTAALRVSAIADASTRVTVKGCNLGQNQAAVDALRELFGSEATVTAPKLKIEMAVYPHGRSRTRAKKSD